MSSQGNAANRLVGLTLENGWYVEEKLPTGRKGGGTGGFFSVSYSVTRGNQKAFLKAFDIVKAMEQARANGQDIVKALADQTQAYNFETHLHQVCLGANMRRIVRILDHGQQDVPPIPGEQISTIPYMVMELADGGDVRSYIDKVSAIDVAIKLTYLRDVASGILQLHGSKIAHQDLKPSNVMIFGGKEAKIGDLGRASIETAVSLHDAYIIAGDRTYAPPEQTYQYPLSTWIDRRQRCDLYQFASLISFVFFGSTINTSTYVKLPPDLIPAEWNGPCNAYLQALPFLQQCFTETLIEWKAQLPIWLADDLINVIKQCGNPDFRERSSSKTRKFSIPSLGLDRIVSELNRLALKASIEVKKIQPRT
ncbi:MULTISPECIES: protein kinase [Pseudomonas]|uniref:protein kinase domain-containing protein n=1 Tax=Pseudomonadaceae TaxID=135621 RepID=UPI0009DD506D|nr:MULTISPECIES: protein kinase [Pseudomonas]